MNNPEQPSEIPGQNEGGIEFLKSDEVKPDENEKSKAPEEGDIHNEERNIFSEQLKKDGGIDIVN